MFRTEGQQSCVVSESMSDSRMNRVQLTLEQHGFVLHKSTHTRIFFHSKCYTLILSTVSWTHRRGTMDTEESCIWKADYTFYVNFWLHRGLTPAISAMFKTQLYTLLAFVFFFFNPIIYYNLTLLFLGKFLSKRFKELFFSGSLTTNLWMKNGIRVVGRPFSFPFPKVLSQGLWKG